MLSSLYAVEAHHIAELGVPKLGRPNALLLFLNPSAHLECKAHGPLQILIGSSRGGVGIH